MRTRLLLILLVLLISLVPGVNAQEPELGTAADNACNVKGSMEGKCISEWHWRCGWFIARYQTGRLTLRQVPADCAAVLILPYLAPVEFQAVIPVLRNAGYFTIVCDCEGEIALWQWYAENAVDFEPCPVVPPDIVTSNPSDDQVIALIDDPNWAFCFDSSEFPEEEPF